MDDSHLELDVVHFSGSSFTGARVRVVGPAGVVGLPTHSAAAT